MYSNRLDVCYAKATDNCLVNKINTTNDATFRRFAQNFWIKSHLTIQNPSEDKYKKIVALDLFIWYLWIMTYIFS